MDGVQAGLPVIDARRADRAGHRSSRRPPKSPCRLSANHPVPVMVQRNGLRARMYGMAWAARRKLLSPPTPMQVGDTL